MSKIRDIKAREILDSRGNPTIETEVFTKRGFGRAAVPSGASTGRYEALELRDSGSRYHGKGVREAVSKVNNEIKNELVGMKCQRLVDLDRKMIELDGTEDKSSLGANAILSVSLAAARAASDESNKELYELLNEKFFPDRKMKVPKPFLNILNGGEHAGNDLAIQEFMIVPFMGAIEEDIRVASEIYHELGKILVDKHGKYATNVGDEGGFAPPLSKTRDAIELVLEATNGVGCSPENEVKLALDAAASEFCKNGAYSIDGRTMNVDQLEDFWIELLEEYPIHSIEDPYDQNDFDAFASLNEKTETMVVGDDLLVTNPRRIRKCIETSACDTLLLKLNQIGTLTEAVDAAKLAHGDDWKVIVSHRSGETTDSFIADLAVAMGAYGIKAGAPARGERTAKYNRLIRINEKIR